MGVADDDIELHIASKQLGHPSLDVVCVNERVSVGFQRLAAIHLSLAGTTKSALAIGPCVLDALEPDVARVVREGFGYGMLAVGVL